ncbi:MAG: AMIN domain-containing protein, partial [Hydrococcus sp. CRU_1_1]|nr:AMIN domain-containing protein [Hydrococcus sp. CRU_1_1]
MSDWGQRIAIASIFSVLLVQASLAEERTRHRSPRVEIRRVHQLEKVSSRAADLLVQQPTSAPSTSPPFTREESEEVIEGQIIPVTGVQLNPTETGIELLLQTPPQSAEQLQPNNISSGNNFIVDIPNAQLQLLDGKPFRAEKPIEGISEVTVNNQDASTIRVTAVGETALPQVELFDSDESLIFGFTPLNPPEARGESSPSPALPP